MDIREDAHKSTLQYITTSSRQHAHVLVVHCNVTYKRVEALVVPGPNAMLDRWSCGSNPSQPHHNTKHEEA
jgi:hypothetical protein